MRGGLCLHHRGDPLQPPQGELWGAGSQVGTRWDPGGGTGTRCGFRRSISLRNKTQLSETAEFTEFTEFTGCGKREAKKGCLLRTGGLGEDRGWHSGAEARSLEGDAGCTRHNKPGAGREARAPDLSHTWCGLRSCPVSRPSPSLPKMLSILRQPPPLSPSQAKCQHRSSAAG